RLRRRWRCPSGFGIGRGRRAGRLSASDFVYNAGHLPLPRTTASEASPREGRYRAYCQFWRLSFLASSNLCCLSGIGRFFLRGLLNRPPAEEITNWRTSRGRRNDDLEELVRGETMGGPVAEDIKQNGPFERVVSVDQDVEYQVHQSTEPISD